MPNYKRHTPSPRERLVETARQMFLAQGVPHVGINAVTEQAKIARMTLYNNFPSKDALVLTVFEQESARRCEVILAAQLQVKDLVGKVLALFDVSLDLTRAKGCRFACKTEPPESVPFRCCGKGKLGRWFAWKQL